MADGVMNGKAIVSTGTRVVIIDVVHYDVRLWLVPAWHEYPREGVQTPARLIALEGLDHRPLEGNPLAQWSVGPTIPIGVLDGSDLEAIEAGYEVHERPAIAMPLQPRRQ